MSRKTGRDTPPKAAPKAPPTGKPPWSAPVALHDVPETGRHVDLVADENVRTAVAQAIGLRDLPRLAARFDVSRHGRDGLRVVGHVSATVGQICVVTLEPIENEIEEAVDLTFAPSAVSELADESGAGSKMAAEDAPEPLVGGVVDLGVVATEFLTLAIDPYPRKTGAEFAAPATADDTPKPFAGLAALKDLAALKKERGGS
jgi:uncharacterized metal-binding protein YceD (DUF177 family)